MDPTINTLIAMAGLAGLAIIGYYVPKVLGTSLFRRTIVAGTTSSNANETATPSTPFWSRRKTTSVFWLILYLGIIGALLWSFAEVAARFAGYYNLARPIDPSLDATAQSALEAERLGYAIWFVRALIGSIVLLALMRVITVLSRTVPSEQPAATTSEPKPKEPGSGRFGRLLLVMVVGAIVASLFLYGSVWLPIALTWFDAQSFPGEQAALDYSGLSYPYWCLGGAMLLLFILWAKAVIAPNHHSSFGLVLGALAVGLLVVAVANLFEGRRQMTATPDPAWIVKVDNEVYRCPEGEIDWQRSMPPAPRLLTIESHEYSRFYPAQIWEQWYRHGLRMATFNGQQWVELNPETEGERSHTGDVKMCSETFDSAQITIAWWKR